ncbi:MAG: hypothetical protein AAGB51_08000 [Planctomycetota bacterium]
MTETETPTNQSPEQPAVPPAGRSKLNRGWVLKIGVIALAALFLAAWFWYDASIVFPARGERSAEWFELDYLRNAEQAGMLAAASIDDPGAALEDAGDPDRLAGMSESRRVLEQSKRAWLESLTLINALDPARTTFPRGEWATARERLNDLEARLATGEQPKPLEAKDIPIQWLMFGFCGLVGALMVLHIFRVSQRVYSWEPDGMKLSLPGGAVLTPDDIEVFDKRRWDKFLIYLRIDQSHAQLGGRELKLDLLRHTNLESWILAMERQRFPESAEEARAEDAGTDADGGPGEPETDA